MKVRNKPPTARVRKGLRLISDLLAEEFEYSFERIFRDATDEDIVNIVDAMEWLEQYAAEEEI